MDVYLKQKVLEMKKINFLLFLCIFFESLYYTTIDFIAAAIIWLNFGL